MKHKDFFYQQYNKLNWEAQEKTKINSLVNNIIIQDILSKKKGSEIKLFDIGFGIGFFFKMVYSSLSPKYKTLVLGGCEPSNKNSRYFEAHPIKGQNTKLKISNQTFQEAKITDTFDFVTAIYVFPHFESEDLEKIAQKIHSILNKDGKFVLVVADEKYLEEKLKSQKDLFIEHNSILFEGKKYQEILHYSELPKIGTITDYNREERYYLDLFKKKGFDLAVRKNLDDNGFICTVLVFQKK